MKYISIVAFLLFLSGCSMNYPSYKDDVVYSSPFDMACQVDSDCRLTDELYHRCGMIRAIHVNTPQEQIDAFNQTQMEKQANISAGDCDLPPSIAGYTAVCRESVCVAIEK